MIHTLISQLALDRAKTILENPDFWSSANTAKISSDAVGGLFSLGLKFIPFPETKEECAKPEKPAAKPAPKPDESKPADV